MGEQLRAFDLLDEPSPTPTRGFRTYAVPGGTVQAHPSDREGLVGMHVDVPRTFWARHDVAAFPNASFPCVVAAECVREFRHPDGHRARTYLLQEGDQYFPIKRASLLDTCLSAAQRASLTNP